MEKAGAGLFEPASPGTPVYAPASGTVLHGGWMKEYGNAVFIRHGADFATFCGGLGIIYVKPGQEVTADTRIGLVGERPEKEIGFHAVRGGDVVGDHTVLFAADGECLELSHRATSRDTLALGALRAAAWLPGHAPALYGMRDVLGLHPGSPA